MKVPKSYDDFRFHHAVLEIRYPKAHRYWDDCGKLIEALETRMPGLECQRLDEQGFQFKGAETAGVMAASFYWDRVIVVQGRDNPFATFADRAAEYWRIVARGLSIERTVRVGHRLWQYLPAASTSEAENWLNTKRLWQFSAASTWGDAVTSGIVLRTVLGRENRAIRLELSSVTIRESGEVFGVMADVDFNLLSAPSRTQLDPVDFMKWNHRFVKDNLANLFAE